MALFHDRFLLLFFPSLTLRSLRLVFHYATVSQEEIHNLLFLPDSKSSTDATPLRDGIDRNDGTNLRFGLQTKVYSIDSPSLKLRGGMG